MKYFYSLIAFFTLLMCSAQVSLSQAEYFWDTDPGEGNGTVVLAVDGNFDSAFERLSNTGIAAPSVGNHKFSIRIKDNTGIWGPTFTNMVVVEQNLTPTPISLSQAEYFWDTDPGEGNGTVVLAVDGNFDSAFERLSNTGIAAPSVGNHKFSIRIKDNTGIWGPTFTNMVIVEQNLTPTPISLSQAEYFWDTDPGEGNGTVVLAVDGNFDSAFERLSNTGIAAPSVGNHKFSIRIKDNTGIWGPTFTNMVIVEQNLTPTPISLSQAEYFWDTDPGEGNGTVVLAVDGNFDSAFERLSNTGIAAPSVGNHKFSIRIKDNTGIWGPTFTNMVIVEQNLTPTPISLSQAEYFWDTDPGEGNGTVVLAVDGNFDSAFERLSNTGIAAPSVGNHKFSIRIKDNTGIWGPTFTNMVIVEQNLTPMPISLSQAEYFWDTDPGEGNGMAIFAIDGNFNAAFEHIFQNGITIAQPIGLHIFNIRIKDNSGVWSPAFKNAIYIETTICNTPQPTASALQNICNSGTVANLVATGTNLKWYSVATNGTALAATTVLTTGNYFVSQTIGNCESTRLMVSVTINPVIAPTFAPIAPICSGGILTALPTTSINGISGSWSPALNNTVTTTYTFAPDAGQCAESSSMTITVNPLVTPTFNQVAPICSGGILTALPTTSENGISGSWSPALDNTATTTYTFAPDPSQCAESTSMTITVNPLVTPTFTQEAPICSGASLIALPTTSNNGITGSWSPALDNTATTTYTFAPDPGQCAESSSMTITVNPIVTPTFTQEAPICSGASLIALPTTSNNGITGSWSPALDNTATTTYTFAPDAGQCAESSSMTITVNPIVRPTFKQIAPICSGGILTALPTTSNNGITGSWSPALDNTATTTYTFAPDAGQCAESSSMTITVNQLVTPTFTQVAPICSGEILTALPTTSNNGITGSWSPALDNTATTTYTFAPDAGQCAESSSMTIMVNPIVTPTFTQVAPICSGESLTALPTTSNNGITGSWSPALDNTASTTYTFTPDIGQCAETSSMTITVNPLVTPIFTQVAPICSGGILTALPTTSNNGITGSWSPALDNTATTTYTFTPDAGQCIAIASMTITVNAAGTISGGNVTVCASGTALNLFGATTTFTNSTTLTLNGNPLGSIVQWQKSINYDSATPTWLSVSNTTTTLNNVTVTPTTLTVLNLSRTIWYRVKVTKGSCITYATPVKITLNPLARAGTVTSATSVCNGGDISFTSAAFTGSSIAWEVSTTSATTGFSTVAGANGLVFTMSNIPYPPLFKFYVRSVVTSGDCTIARSGVRTITVSPVVTPTFTQLAPICSGASLTTLPTTSNNGITGSWSPAFDNTATTTYTFAPDAGQCAESSSMTIIVNPLVTPTFTQVAPICSGGILIALPRTSNNGITGSWSPALDNTATTTYTFAPDAGQCAESSSMTITVNPIVTPTFTQEAPICSGASLIALPTTSNNGITGSWSPALDNTATTTYTFAPDPGQCAETSSMTITVNPIVTPTFTQVAPICSGGILTALPTTSNNGITGSWSPALDNTATTTYTFTPDAGRCIAIASMTITVNAAGTISGGNVTVCASGTALDLFGTTTAFTNSTTLTLNGNPLGSIVQWQKSINYDSATPTWSVVSNTTTTLNNVTVTPTTLTVLNLSRTIWYRVKVTNGSCISYATPVKITLNPLARAGTVTSPTSVCNGGDISFTSAAFTGSSIAWEVSTTSATTGFNTVAGANGLVFTMSNIPYPPLFKFYVRSVVTSGDCTIARSGVRTITVSPIAVAGTVTGVGTVCSGSNNLLRISNSTGSIQWMFSNNGINFYDVPYNSTTLGYQNPSGATTFTTTSLDGSAAFYYVNNITATTYFKAVVKSGVCSTAESNVVQYTVGTSATAGVASAAATTVCSGQGTVISLTGSEGAIKWQKSTNWTATTPTWTTITTNTSSTLPTDPLTVPTAYRASVSIGSCSPTVYSNVVAVTIDCNARREISAPLKMATPFEVIAFPSPYRENFNLKLTSSNEDKVAVLVYDMLGKLIERREIKRSEVSELQLGNNYASGIYNVIVTQGEQIKTLRVIKE